MARQRVKERNQPVSISFPPTMLRRLDDYADIVGLSRSELVMMSLREHLPDQDELRNNSNREGLAQSIIVGIDLTRFNWRRAKKSGAEKPDFPIHLCWNDEYVRRWILPECSDGENPDWRGMVPEDILEWIDAYLPNLEQMYNVMDDQEFWDYIEGARRKLLLLVNPNAFRDQEFEQL